MNRPPPLSARQEDTIPEELLLNSRHFSPRQLRVLRKEILMLRTAVERAEVAQAGAELRQKFSHFGWLKWLAPTWTTIGKSELGSLGAIMKKYPMLSSLASIAMSGSIRRTATQLVKPAAKLGVVAFAGWSVWKVWQSMQDDTPEAAKSSAAATDHHVAAND